MATFNEDDMKILRLSGPTILKGLENRMRICLDTMYGRYRAGHKDFITDVAEFAVIKDQMTEITNALNKES